MKVLIADFDLFAKVGGGQTFYRNLILKNPEINFYYTIRQEARDIQRPANVQVIPYQELHFLADFKNFFDVTPPK